MVQGWESLWDVLGISLNGGKNVFRRFGLPIC